MTLETRWVPDAVEDMQGGHDWYEEREPGLGRDFAVAVFETLDQTRRFPLVPRRYDHVRKAQLERFNEYGIVYTVVGDTIWILAVAHAKRRPGYWAGRLKSVPSDARE